MPMYAYALALFARDRGEKQPSWAKHLRADVAADFKRFAKHLAGPAAQIPQSLRQLTWSELNPLATPHARDAVDDDVPDADLPEGDIGEPAEDEGPSPDCEVYSATDLQQRYANGERSFVDGDFQEALLKRINLDGSNLRNADFCQAVLIGANIDNTDLRHADLTDCDLQGATLRRANLNGADLRGADLTNANLRGADIRNANFRNARLTNTDLTRTTCNSQTNFAGVDLATAISDVGWNDQKHAAVRSSSILAEGSGRMGWVVLFMMFGVLAFLGAGLCTVVVNIFLEAIGSTKETKDLGVNIALFAGVFVTLLGLFWASRRRQQ